MVKHLTKNSFLIKDGATKQLVACEGILSINERQKQIFKKVESIIKKEEPIPTVAELGQLFGITQQAMSKNLKVLEDAGYIRRNPSKHKSIELVGRSVSKATRVKLLGRIAAGQPLEAIETEQGIEVPTDHLPSDEAYALEVSGDSMVEDGILNGDIVIVKRQTVAYNGQTVVAIINNEATLKRYYHEGDRIRLQPANQSLSPIYAGPNDDFEIRGIVFALYRKYPAFGAWKGREMFFIYLFLGGNLGETKRFLVDLLCVKKWFSA